MLCRYDRHVPGAQSPFPQHFDGKHFYNPNGRQALGFREVLRWKRTSSPEPSPRFIADVVPSTPFLRVEGSGMRVTLVNHSTVLLQQSGINILTDPMWSRRASPFSWIGPARRRAPGVEWADLPPVDIVLLSHNHYDHLDVPTLRRLGARGKSEYVVPTGVGRMLRARRIGPVHELDWGDSQDLSGVRVHSVPAFHFSSRGLFDRNRTLWSGYILEFPERLAYFAGDTAFGNHFAQIRERFGTPDVALLPIGAYEPRWFMSAVHMAPDEAVTAHRILGAKTSIAIHHGTFQLADEGLDTPAKKLLECVGSERFIILRNGQSADIT